MWNELGLREAASRDLFNESAPLEADQNEGYASIAFINILDDVWVAQLLHGIQLI